MLTDILKSVRRLEVVSRNKITSLFAGNYRSAFTGRGIEFADIRPYDMGDDVRDIDWKTTSKQGELFVKTYHETRDNTLFFVVDGTAAMHFSSTKRKKYEQLLETFALLAFSAVMNGDRVGMLFYNEEGETIFPPKKGRKHILQMLLFCITQYQRPMCRYHPVRLQHVFSKTLLFLKHPTHIFWLQGSVATLSNAEKKGIKMLAARHDVVPFVFIDPMEEDFSFRGEVRVQDSFSGKISSVVVDAETQKQFRKQRKEKLLRFQEFCKKHHIRPVFFRAHTKAFSTLYRFFQERQKR